MHSKEPELQSLFEDFGGVARCVCGRLVSTKRPSYCSQCREVHKYWTLTDGTVITLGRMKLGHLSSSIKMLAEQIDKYQSRSEIEEALDIMYAELATRDKEIAQDSGILAGLRKAFNE